MAAETGEGGKAAGRWRQPNDGRPVNVPRATNRSFFKSLNEIVRGPPCPHRFPREPEALLAL